MAEFSEWIHGMHTETQANTKPSMASYVYSYSYKSTDPASWTSEENDTDSESEQLDGFQCRRKQTTKGCKLRKERPASRAAPVVIPARTHDFGWCDRDDDRVDAREAACPCGNDCDQFFNDDAQNARATCSHSSESNQEAASDDFIFDMEM